MSSVQACLQPSEGPACVSGPYGEVRGSAPNWRGNFGDAGRHHTSGPASEFSGAGGFTTWDNSSPSRQVPVRRHVEGPSTSTYAEPAVSGAHSSYYARRAAQEGQEGGYRRTMREVAEPPRPDRPEGKRSIPEPYGAPPQPRGTRPPPDEAYRPSDTAAEPGMPRLGRPAGITGLRESDKELQFESALGRKVRVGQQSYVGTGRAGDKSLVYGAPSRVEDEPSYFKSMKDSPTFTRFCQSLPPPPAVSPHQRRQEQMRQQAEAERKRAADLVSTLTIDGVPDDD